jgi:conjugative relaxase-like TrwC/TraI family protein
MLRIIQSNSAAAAKSYYAEGLSKEDYYSEGQEIAGRWGGQLAASLELSGQVDKAGFDALCDNVNPATGERLTARMKGARRVGYDINFHCPKSVSVLYALTGDEAILTAFRESVRDTMREIETAMQTRVRVGGRSEDRATANMAWAEFVHFTARPVGGVPDPHLHAHCFTFNATLDREEGKIKAGQFGSIKRDAPYYEAGFHARLASRLAALGYGIERTAKGWDVAGVPASLIDKFSRRTAEIEAHAKAKGITDAKRKDELGAKLRAGKRRGLTKDDLKAEWSARLDAGEASALRRAKGQGTALPVSDAAAFGYALAHAFERSSVVSEKRLMAEALRHGVGSVTVEGIAKQAAQAGLLSRLVEGQKLATTRGVLAEEQAMIALARSERGAHRSLASGYQLAASGLSGEQQKAVRHILHSRDGVIGIRGGAGVGKTSLMREAVAGIEASGKQVFTFAPSALASRGVLRAEGFGEADTVASLLANKDTQAKIAGQVVWVDEAGLIGAGTMRKLLTLAKEKEARVILSGDVRQHGAVERGDALRILEDNGGLVSAEVRDIRRQRGTYKEAVAAISRGDVARGFETLERMGAVVEAGDGERHRLLAGDYLQAVKEGKSALVVSPTHAEGRKVTEAIRGELKRAGRIGKDEKSFLQCRNLSLTEAQRGDAKNYQPGYVVQFHQNARGFANGEKLTVKGRDGRGVTVTRADGESALLPLNEAKKFSVYDSGQLPLAAGDRLRITQNGFTLSEKKRAKGHRLNNGAVYEVEGFTKAGDIKLSNGWVVPKDYGHLAHGYVSTSHAAQGATVDRVLIAQSSASLPAASKEQFYVSVSRGREGVKLYTDDKSALLDAVGASSARLSAVDLVKEEQKTKAAKLLDVKRQAVQVNRLAALAKIYAARTAQTTRDFVAKYSRKWSDRSAIQQRDRGMDYER